MHDRGALIEALADLAAAHCEEHGPLPGLRPKAGTGGRDGPRGTGGRPGNRIHVKPAPRFNTLDGNPSLQNDP